MKKNVLFFFICSIFSLAFSDSLTSSSTSSLYEILDLKNFANSASIRRAYRKLAVNKHPDKLADSSTTEDEVEKIEGQYLLLSRAYGVLSDITSKQRYDYLLNKEGKLHYDPLMDYSHIDRELGLKATTQPGEASLWQAADAQHRISLADAKRLYEEDLRAEEQAARRKKKEDMDQVLIFAMGFTLVVSLAASVIWACQTDVDAMKQDMNAKAIAKRRELRRNACCETEDLQIAEKAAKALQNDLARNQRSESNKKVHFYANDPVVNCLTSWQGKPLGQVLVHKEAPLQVLKVFHELMKKASRAQSIETQLEFCLALLNLIQTFNINEQGTESVHSMLDSFVLGSKGSLVQFDEQVSKKVKDALASLDLKLHDFQDKKVAESLRGRTSTNSFDEDIDDDRADLKYCQDELVKVLLELQESAVMHLLKHGDVAQRWEKFSNGPDYLKAAANSLTLNQILDSQRAMGVFEGHLIEEGLGAIFDLWLAVIDFQDHYMKISEVGVDSSSKDSAALFRDITEEICATFFAEMSGNKHSKEELEQAIAQLNALLTGDFNAEIAASYVETILEEVEPLVTSSFLRFTGGKVLVLGEIQESRTFEKMIKEASSYSMV